MDTSFPKVGIVVLNYNGQDCLFACLTSLQSLQYSNACVFVVDNASADSSLLEAEEKFPEYTYISLPENRGFAGGMNVGIQRALSAGATWVWLLNNDAEVEAESLSLLMSSFSQSKILPGALSPRIVEKTTENIWFEKGRFDFLRMRVVHSEPYENERKTLFYKSDFLTGCALLISKEALERVGFLDETFFLYYEDADFSLRLKKAGLERWVVPGAKVWHRERSQSNPQKLYHLVLSGLLFFQKHASFWQRLYFAGYVTIRRIKNKIDIWRGRDEALVVQRAYKDFYHDQ